MNHNKIILMALALSINGAIAGFNARWIREGSSPWWTVYLVSIVSSTIFGYQLKQNLMPLTTASVFQHFFFHFSWYFVTIVILGEPMSFFKSLGLAMAFTGMLLMSVK